MRYFCNKYMTTSFINCAFRQWLLSYKSNNIYCYEGIEHKIGGFISVHVSVSTFCPALSIDELHIFPFLFHFLALRIQQNTKTLIKVFFILFCLYGRILKTWQEFVFSKQSVSSSVSDASRLGVSSAFDLSLQIVSFSQDKSHVPKGNIQ